MDELANMQIDESITQPDSFISYLQENDCDVLQTIDSDIVGLNFNNNSVKIEERMRKLFS